MGPFVFFNLTKTKYMQIMTTITRWLGKLISIALLIIYAGIETRDFIASLVIFEKPVHCV